MIHISPKRGQIVGFQHEIDGGHGFVATPKSCTPGKVGLTPP
jgi:hypothetical protein